MIELLVVIAIIALLIGILLPALGSARASARAVAAGVNARSVGQGLDTYTASEKDFYPFCYVYPTTPGGTTWAAEGQLQSDSGNPNGYLHWSFFLFDNNVSLDAFENPGSRFRGAPRTNWGNDADETEQWQISDTGAAAGTIMQYADSQVPRTGFVANGALIPRNKINNGLIPGPRWNKQVKTGVVGLPSKTILVTEFADDQNWRLISNADASSGGGSGQSKSHRPVVGFKPGGSDSFYTEIVRDATSQRANQSFRAYTEEDIEAFIESRGSGNINVDGESLQAVGSIHSGRTNFAFSDGHVELLDLVDTVKGIGLWGERFYSITGNNDVLTNADLERLNNP